MKLKRVFTNSICLFLMALSGTAFPIILTAQCGLSLTEPHYEWDGITHWTKYLRVSSSYFGPNALPVPYINKGNFSEDVEISLSAENYTHKYEKTYNLFTRAFFPVVKRKVALEVSIVPVETYQTDLYLREARRTFENSGETGIAGGDFYVGSYFQLFNKASSMFPDVNLRVAIKTASGTNIQHARYTDTPGYYFDLGIGKTYEIRDSLTIRPYGEIGFYAYQTYCDNNRQNDAILWGVGADIEYNDSWNFSCAYSGYDGYFNEGDKPSVLRLFVNKKWTNLSAFIGWEKGFRDFPFDAYRIGTTWHIKSRSLYLFKSGI